NDAGSGQPTPVRIRFNDSAGSYLAPFGRLTDFATAVGEDVGGNLLLDGKEFAFIDGGCEINLPAGTIAVSVRKGPEDRPLHQHTELAAGKMALRFTVERWIDLRAEGWYSGDTRAHFLSPHAALLEAAAEDLAVVNLLAFQLDSKKYPSVPGLLAFSGQQP